MRVRKSWLAPALICAAVSPLAAEEAATTIARPALRAEAANACRVLNPTFSPDAPGWRATDANYPGGGKLSVAIASPCPPRGAFYDV